MECAGILEIISQLSQQDGECSESLASFHSRMEHAGILEIISQLSQQDGVYRDSRDH